MSGGFRAPLAADVAAVDGFTPFGVGLNASGQVVVGAGNTGVKGIMITHGKMSAGDIVDVMTAGEIVSTTETWTAGTNYTTLTTTGVVGTTAADGTHIGVGFTVEAGRMVVGKHV